jgi:hypothetical protein
MGAHDAGAIRPYSCQRALAENTRNAKLTDDYIKGIVSVGMMKGVEAREASAMLAEQGAAFFLPYPYREYAVLCVPKGDEEEWVEAMEEQPLVEWSHTEGVKPLQSENR